MRLFEVSGQMPSARLETSARRWENEKRRGEFYKQRLIDTCITRLDNVTSA